MHNKRQKLRYLGDVCRGCGRTVQDILDRHGTINRVFQFHHTDPVTKHPEYDKLIQRKITTEQIDELDKCALLCSLCHDLVESQDIDATVTLGVEIDGRRGEQTFRGQMIWDRVEKLFRFVTNEHYRLNPCRVQLGDEPPRMEFENELIDCTMVRYLRELKDHRTLVIRLWPDGPVLFHARQLDSGNIQVEYDTRCPLLNLNLGGGEQEVWVRNGCFITEDGELHHDGYTVELEIFMLEEQV